MPKVRLVIADEAKAHDANLRSYERGLGAGVSSARRRTVAAAHAGAPRPVGTVHAEAMETACPEARPNCRQCGDPAHTAACQAAGHCPECGTLHGIAPDAVLAANGYALESAE